MANTKGLHPPFSKESPDEAREYGKIGGVKSGASRRRKKTIAETLDKLLNEKITDQKQLAIINKSGMPLSKAPTYKDFLVASTIMKSIKRGSVDDLEKMAALIGETVKDEQRENGMLADLIDGLKDEE